MSFSSAIDDHEFEDPHSNLTQEDYAQDEDIGYCPKCKEQKASGFEDNRFGAEGPGGPATFGSVDPTGSCWECNSPLQKDFDDERGIYQD